MSKRKTAFSGKLNNSLPLVTFMRFKGRTVLVTGGSKGIGRAVVEAFLAEGARVLMFSRSEPVFQGAQFFRVDIRKEEDIVAAFQNIHTLDILVNNAGVYCQSGVAQTSVEELDLIIDTNLKGPYLVVKHALPLLLEGKGVIINVASGLGLAPEPQSPAYCSSKAGLLMLTRCLAQAHAAKGLRVNAVLPGPIDTGMLRDAFGSKKELEDYKQLNPMKRFGTAEEVAKVVLFLASEDASFVTGAFYSVDGGEGSSSLYSR